MSLSVPAVMFAALLSAAPSGARRVAVLDFNARWASRCGDANMNDAQEERCEALRLFADQARGGALAVLRPPAFVVMTRENTAQILKDMGGQCSEGECEVETARLLGASVVVSGEVSYMEGIWLVSIKVHDVATAALLGTGNTEGKSKLEAFRNVRAETQRMLKEAVGLDGGGAHAAAPPPTAAVAPKAAEPPKQVEPARPPPPPPPPREVEALAPPSPPAAVQVARPVPDAQPRAAEPADASPPPAADGSFRRWFVEARGGVALNVGGYVEPQDARPTPLGKVDASAGFRLNPTWSFHATVSVLPEREGSYLGLTGGPVHIWLSAERVALGAAWSPGGSRYFSIAAELGVANVGVRAKVGTPAYVLEQNKDALSAGVEARVDFPLGSAWYVGARAGVVAAMTGFDLKADVSATETFRYESDSIFIPVSAAVGYRF